MLDYERTDPWSIAGSGIITQHPDYPSAMREWRRHGVVLMVLQEAVHSALSRSTACRNTGALQGSPLKLRHCMPMEHGISGLGDNRISLRMVRVQVNTRHRRNCWRTSFPDTGLQHLD